MPQSESYFRATGQGKASPQLRPEPGMGSSAALTNVGHQGSRLPGGTRARVARIQEGGSHRRGRGGPRQAGEQHRTARLGCEGQGGWTPSPKLEASPSAPARVPSWPTWLLPRVSQWSCHCHQAPSPWESVFLPSGTLPSAPWPLSHPRPLGADDPTITESLHQPARPPCRPSSRPQLDRGECGDHCQQGVPGEISQCQ